MTVGGLGARLTAAFELSGAVVIGWRAKNDTSRQAQIGLTNTSHFA
jgi:hypothetical protein